MNGNGTKLWIWLVGVLVSIIIAGGGAWMGVIQANLSSVEDLQRQRGERISMLEARQVVLEAQLSRIEQKLDALLARSR